MISLKKNFLLTKTLFQNNYFSFSNDQQSYKFPQKNFTNLEKHFFPNPNTIIIDKTPYISELMNEKSNMIFLQRPGRLGKTMFLNLIEYLYFNGLISNELKEKYPELVIFKKELFPDQEKWDSINSKQFLPIKLDFSQNFQMFSEEKNDQIFFREIMLNEIKKLPERLLEKNQKLIQCSLFQNKEKIKKNLALIDQIYKLIHAVKSAPGSYEIILNEFLKFDTNQSKLVILIDNYESLIINDLDNKKKLAKTEKKFRDFLVNLRLMGSQTNSLFLEKVIITSSIFIKNLPTFSSDKLFENLSFKDKYLTTFGFTLKELQEGKVKSTIKRLLSKHMVQENDQNNEISSEILENYIKRLFEEYKGFSVKNDLNEKNSIISPISFIEHMNYMEKTQPNKFVPYNFQNYWTSTIRTRNFEKFLAKTEPNFIEKEKKTIADYQTAYLSKHASSKIMRNLLLFHSGYFSTKGYNSAKQEYEVDWTSKETKAAFYAMKAHYFDIEADFLVRFFKDIQKVDAEKERLTMQDCLYGFHCNLLTIYKKILHDSNKKKNLILGFQFFKNIFKSLISKKYNFHVYDQMTSSKEKRPDMIFLSNDQKIALIVNFENE